MKGKKTKLLSCKCCVAFNPKEKMRTKELDTLTREAKYGRIHSFYLHHTE